MTATSQAGTPSSTIITRFSVPISSTAAMPTETWNSDSRSSRPSGSSGVAASANGRKPGPSWLQPRRERGVEPLHARRELQRLRGVEAAGDPLRPRRPPGARAPGAPASRRCSASTATGSIAGARSPRGNSRPTACIAASGGRARREGEEHGPRRRGRRGRPRARTMSAARSGSASPSRRRGRSGRARGRACRRPGTRCEPVPEIARRALAGEADQGRREVDGDDLRRRAARPRRRGRRCRSRRRGRGGRAGRRAARRAGCRASGRGRRARWRGCGRPARRRSAAPRPRPRCGRNRSSSCAAARRRR